MTGSGGDARSSWFDRKVLMDCMDSDPHPLLDACLDEIRRSDHRGPRETRVGDTIKFSSSNSLTVDVSGKSVGRWSDFASVLSFNGKSGGYLWGLAGALGISADDMARFYPACHRGAAPELIERVQKKADVNRQKRDEDSFKEDEAKRRPVKMSLGRAEDVTGNVLTYLEGRGVGHLAMQPSIQMIDRPHARSLKTEEIYQIQHRCLAGLVTNDEGGIEGLALTPIDSQGQAIIRPGKKGADGKQKKPSKARQSSGLVSRGYLRVGTPGSRSVVVCEGLEDAGAIAHADAWPNARVLASIGGLRVEKDREIAHADKVVLALDRELIPERLTDDKLKAKAEERLGSLVDTAKVAAPFADIFVAQASDDTDGEKADLCDVLAQHGADKVKVCLDKARRVAAGRSRPVSLREGQAETQKLVMGVMEVARHRQLAKAMKRKAHEEIVIHAQGSNWNLDSAVIKRKVAQLKRSATSKIKKQFKLKKIGGRHRLVLRVTPGVGKSYAMLDGLQWLLDSMPANEPFTIVVATSSTMLADQHHAGFMGRCPSATARVIRGRGNEHTPEEERVPLKFLDIEKQGHDPLTPCPRHVAFNSLATKGEPARKLMCGSCALSGLCGFRKQEAWLEGTKEQTRVLFVAHAYLGLLPAQRPWKSADLVILDENVIPATIQHHELPVSAFLDEVTLGAMVKKKDLSASLETLKDLTRAANTGMVGDVTQKSLSSFIKALQDGRGRVSGMSGADPDHIILDRVNKMSGRYRSALSAFASFVKRHIKIGKKKLRLTRYGEGNAKDKRGIRWTSASTLKIATDTPVLAIDGTSRRDLIQSAIGDHEFIRIDVQRNADVTNSSNTFSNRSLTAEDFSEDHIINILRALSEVKGRFLLGSTKIVLDKMRAVAEGTEFEEVLDRCCMTHLGASQGSNEFEHLNTVVVIGRLSAPVQAVEDQTYATLLALGEDRDMITVEAHCAEKRIKPRQDGYVDRDGQPWHPDPLGEEIRKSITDDSIIQFIDRVRTVRKEKPVNVIMMSNIELDELPADRKIPAYRIKSDGTLTGSRFEQHIARSLPSKVIPISPTLVHEVAGDFYRSANAAKMDMKKALNGKKASDINDFKKGPNSISNKYGDRTPFGRLISGVTNEGLQLWGAYRSSTQKKALHVLATLDASEDDLNEVCQDVIRWEKIAIVNDKHEHRFFDVSTSDRVQWLPQAKLKIDRDRSAAIDKIVREVLLEPAPAVKPKSGKRLSKEDKFHVSDAASRAASRGAFDDFMGTSSKLEPERGSDPIGGRPVLATDCVDCGKSCIGVMPTDYVMTKGGKRRCVSCDIFGQSTSSDPPSDVLESEALLDLF